MDGMARVVVQYHENENLLYSQAEVMHLLGREHART